MTISTTNNKTTLVANGVLVQFDFTFKIFATSDIGVYVDDVLTTTGFTVSGLDSDSGGSITFSTPPLDQKTITMIRSIEFTQEADYVEGDPFSPDVHERQLDRQVMMNQQSKEVIDRSIQMPASESNGVLLPSSAARSSRVLSFDSSGDLEAGPLTVDVQAVADNATNINAAAANETNINAAVANATNINAAVANAANINTVAGISDNITSVAGNATNINSAVSNAANINAAVANETNINAAVTNATNINSAVANATNINSVAAISTDVTSTASNGVDISFVADNLTEILAAAAALAALDTATTSDGWTSSSDTWVYVDANTFKIVGVDRSSQFPVGAKVQLTNPAVKYRYVSSVAFSTDTTVTLLNNAGTALANSVITLPKYSYQDTPAGFPNWGSGDQISALALEVAANGIPDTLSAVLVSGNTTGGTDLSVSIGDDITTAAAASFNLRLGAGAGASIVAGGNSNTLVGDNSGTSTTTGYHNTATGYDSLGSNVNGIQNTTSGYESMANNIGGHYNTASGYRSLNANTSGLHNSAFGFNSLKENTTGGRSTAFGAFSLTSPTTAQYNSAFGYGALYATTTGHSNSAVGYEALGAMTTAIYNTAVGHQSCLNLTSGSYNVTLGRRSGENITTGTHNTVLGYYGRPASGTEVAAVVIGANVIGYGGYTTTGNSTSDIRAAHGSTTWSTVSDERYKKDITDSTAGLDFVNSLRPRTWNYRTLGELPETFSAYEEGSSEVFKNTQTNHGFIAQEVKAAINADSGIKDGFRMWDDRDDGSQEVAEAALIPVLVKAIQELTARLAILEGK